MKKKVLFIMPSMYIGGAERSLLGLLESFDYSEYDISLFLYRHEGEFLKLLPSGVRVLDCIPKYATFDVPISGLLKSKYFMFGISRIFGKIRLFLKKKFTGDSYGVWASMQYTSRSLLWLLPDIPGKYDAAVSFLGIPDVLLKKAKADVRLCWNHTDYTALNADKKYDCSLYSKIDKIISVSDECRNQFISVYPQFADKAAVLENIISSGLLQDQSEEQINEFSDNRSEFILLSIGRFCEAKNFDNVPDITRRLIEKGIDARWYLIGYGGDEALIRSKISESGMEDRVIILGKKENPYPYIKACDLYVQPSRYEGKCVAVREAQMINKPVVITNYATSGSQLTDGYDGIIVPMDNEGCAEGIAAVLKDAALREKLIENTKNNDYSNAKEIEKLYRLIENED